jgi:hypothetical protein
MAQTGTGGIAILIERPSLNRSRPDLKDTGKQSGSIERIFPRQSSRQCQFIE